MADDVTVEPEPHEVTACYDNVRAVLSRTSYPWPTLLCSCGYKGQGDTWEEAGADFDAHYLAIRDVDPALLEGD